MGTLEDRVAETVFAKFDALPSKSKPRKLSTGGQEWVPLSGIVIVKGLRSHLRDIWRVVDRDHRR